MAGQELRVRDEQAVADVQRAACGAERLPLRNVLQQRGDQPLLQCAAQLRVDLPARLSGGDQNEKGVDAGDCAGKKGGREGSGQHVSLIW